MGSEWFAAVRRGVFLKLSACVAFTLGAASPAAAQFEDKTCLVFDSQFSIIIRMSAIALDFKEVVSAKDDTNFVASLQSKQWDLIGIERAHAEIVKKAEILDLFKQQLAGGARFIVSYAHLDEWPELQEFMGVESAVDVGEWEFVGPVPPGNPVWFKDENGIPMLEDIWPDHGDVLSAGPDSIVFSLFKDGTAAGTLSNDRTRICNGWNFDESDVAGAEVQDQIVYLLGCGADLFRDGILDQKDYNSMHGLFLASRGPANFDFDDKFTFFDYLAFINKFLEGCPH